MDELTFKLPVESITEEDMNEVIRYNSRCGSVKKTKHYMIYQALKNRGILNDLDKDESPKKCIHSDGYLYAFVYDWTGCADDVVKGFALWVRPVDVHQEWCEVTDLTSVTVYTYQMLKEIAVSIGWIDEDSKWLI